MNWSSSTSALLLACSACVVTTSGQPSRFKATVATKFGAAFVDDPAPDGPTSSGFAIGLHPTVQAKIGQRWSAGLALDLTHTSHATMIEKRSVSFWTFFMPVAVARYEERRFALSAWGGYYIGFRSITEPGGSFGTRTFSSEKLHGASVATSALVRLGHHIELGPFVQLALMVSKEDDTRTVDIDEEGMRFRSTIVGVMTQLAF